MEKNHKIFPDFYVVGAMKAGTTSLHTTLTKSTYVEMSSAKEPNVLLKCKSSNEIYGAYNKLFHNDGKILGEVSPKYSLMSENVNIPKKIHNLNPNAKIVFIARDPIKRIESHLNHDLLRSRFTYNKWEENLWGLPDYINGSSYYLQLSPYLKYFKISKILVLTLENLINKPDTELKHLFNFLGCAENDIESFDHSYDTQKRYLIKYHDQFHSIVKNKYLSRIYHLFWFTLNIRPKRIYLSLSEKEKVNKRLKGDLDIFIRTFSVDHKQWENF